MTRLSLTIKTLIRKLVILRNYLSYKAYNLFSQINQKKFSLNPQAHFVTSIASYPKRSHLLPAVFEALSRQTVKPRKMLLVLTEEEWPGFKIPEYIEKLVSRGVEIVWTKENPYAVKKIVPVIIKYPKLGIVILDDDVIYGKEVVELIVCNRYAQDNCIVGHVAKSIHRRGQELSMWFRATTAATRDTDSNQVFFIGYGGVYYPPNSLDSKVTNLDAIKKIVPGRGKDIWLYAAAIGSGTKQVCLGTLPARKYYIPIPVTKATVPKDRPGQDVLELRFQEAIDYFGIREKLLKELPDASDIQ